MSFKNIAAIVSGMDEEYPNNIILGINKFARSNNINVSYFAAFGGIIDSKEFNDGEYSIYNLPDFSAFDGVLLMSNTFSNPVVRNTIIERVKASGKPTVIFECNEHEEFHNIGIDNYAVMFELVEHLIVKHGARVFNFVSGPQDNPEARDRYRAFRDALAKHGIEFDEENRLFKGLFRSYDGMMAFEAFEQSGLCLPDAFVCANDSMGLSLMSRLQQTGRRVPEDVIVTGFDHTFNAQNSCPTLTTVRRPLFESGEKACSILLNLMNGGSESESVHLEALPVFTESCGCGPVDVEDIQGFKKNTYAVWERTYSAVHMLNRLIAGLAGAENIGECLDHIEEMLNVIECDNFSLCLVNNWENTYNTSILEVDSSFYCPLMNAPIVVKDGIRYSLDTFPSSQLRPDPLTTGGNISYYLPLHHDQRCLGYYIMTNNDFPIFSLLCHTMTMCIGNAIDHISKLNVMDPLCKIYNRNGFNKNAAELFRECIDSGETLSLCFIDMDGLKKINDTYGHKEGDYAIKCVADSICNSCGPADLCGRFGGDEFIVMGKGEGFADRFEREFDFNLEQINMVSDKPYRITASVGGITTVPDHPGQLLELIQQADHKMYERKKAKRRGKA